MDPEAVEAAKEAEKAKAENQPFDAKKMPPLPENVKSFEEVMDFYKDEITKLIKEKETEKAKADGDHAAEEKQEELEK